MAENKGKTSQLDDDLLLEEEERDILFRTQMAIANFALGYWKHAVALLGIALLITLGYGLWDSHRLTAQRGIHAQVARVLSEYSIEVQKTIGDPDAGREAAAAGAHELGTIADDGWGPGAIWAWVCAGQLWSAIDDDETANQEAVAAWHAADEKGGKGIMGWAAAAGYANALIEAGDVDQAAQVYLRIADAKQGVVSEEALFTLGQAYLEADRNEDSARIFLRFTTDYPGSALIDRAGAALQRAQGNN